MEHFGCRAARADGEAVSSRLRASGLSEQRPAEADLVIVNTCSVTAEADRAARAFIRRAHRRNPQAKIVVTGCYAQRAPQELAGLSGVAAVVGNSHKALAPEIIFGLAHGATHSVPLPPPLVPVQSLLAASPLSTAPIWVDDRFAHSFIEDAHLAPGGQTRPNLKIQEGCGNRCTFCVIPHTRGRSRSLPRDVVLRKVEAFVSAGGKELVLSGINLGQWGRDSSSPTRETLAGLIHAIFAETNLPRLRLSSIEPMDWDNELIALVQEQSGRRLARHAHLPLQSGSDAVLRRMHRRYRPWHYAHKVAELLRAAGPELTLGADVMVGFPGESDREFEETLSFIRSLPFGYLHLFPFSPRPGTPGAALHSEFPVPAVQVDERMAVLRAVAAEKSRAHRSRAIGSQLSAITLQTPARRVARGLTSAITDNFLPIEIEHVLPANQLLSLRITGLSDESILQAVVLQ